MKKLEIRIFLTGCLLLLSAPLVSAAAYTQDSGKISTLFVNSTGSIAISLTNGFPNAQAGGQCSTSNGFGGNSAADPVLKSALLAAKSAQQNITVTVVGCDAGSGGGWYKITEVYVN